MAYLLSITAKTSEGGKETAHYLGYKIYNALEQQWAMNHFRANYRTIKELHLSYSEQLNKGVDPKRSFRIPAKESGASYWIPGADNKPVLVSCDKAAKMFKKGELHWVCLNGGSKQPTWSEAQKEFSNFENLLAHS
jgi:hypothetical protein